MAWLIAVGADAGGGAVALAQDLVRAAADDGDQGVDAGVGLALRIGPCELGVSGVERRIRIVNGILRTRIGLVEGPAVQRGVQAPRFDGPPAGQVQLHVLGRPLADRARGRQRALVEHGEEVALRGAGGLKHGDQVGLQGRGGGCLRHAPKRSRAEGRQQGAGARYACGVTQLTTSSRQSGDARPAACTLDEGELRERLAATRARSSDGPQGALRWPPTSHSRVARLVDLESQCCGFFGSASGVGCDASSRSTRVRRRGVKACSDSGILYRLVSPRGVACPRPHEVLVSGWRWADTVRVLAC